MFSFTTTRLSSLLTEKRPLDSIVLLGMMFTPETHTTPHTHKRMTENGEGNREEPLKRIEERIQKLQP